MNTSSQQDNGTYLVTDQTGTAIAIPNGTTFYGEWEQVSSPVEFFICYGGTILDTEGDVKVRNEIVNNTWHISNKDYEAKRATATAA